MDMGIFMSTLDETLKKIDDDLSKEKDDNKIQAYCLTVIKQLDKFVVDFPQNAQVFSLRGKILGKLKRFSEGIKDFENALSLSKPIDPEILYRYGNLLSANMKYDEAIKQFERCIGLSAGKHAKACNNIAVAYSLLRKYDAAIPFADRAIQQEKNAQYYFNRAMLYFKKLGELSEKTLPINFYRLIIQDLETAVCLDPTTRNYRKNLIDIIRRLQKELETVNRSQPENKKYRKNLVEINQKMKDVLVTAVRLEPESRRYHKYLDEINQTQQVPVHQATEQDEEEINHPQYWQPSFSDEGATPSVDSVPPLLPPPIVTPPLTRVKTRSQSRNSLPPDAPVAVITPSEPSLNPMKRKSGRGSQTFFSPEQVTPPTPYETSKRQKQATTSSSGEYVAPLAPPSLPRAQSSDKITHAWQSQPKTPTPPQLTPTPPKL